MSVVRRWLIMTVLAFSGGIIFLLPFLFEVYYRPMAEVFGLTNTQLGRFMSVFGLVSMLAYFPGGWIADRVSPRVLMTTSLITTGLAGLYFATFPPYWISVAIHAFWGVSITFLFWGAMIRVTRNWAPADEQGRAFGILEAIRGVGELVPHVGLLAIFAWLGSGEKALSVVIAQLSSVIVVLGVLSWFVIEDVPRDGADQSKTRSIGFQDVIIVLRLPIVWLMSIIVLTGYCAYWGSLYFSAYVTDVFLTTATIAGVIGGIGRMMLKPVAAVVAGFVADRFGISISIAFLFGLLIASFVGFALMPGDSAVFSLLIANIAVAGIAIFAMRAIYFALLEEGGVPLAVTGTAAGIVSAIGFTPDVFMPMIFGSLLDAYPGGEGYRYFYLTIAGFCTIGMLAAMFIYYRFVKNRSMGSEPPLTP